MEYIYIVVSVVSLKSRRRLLLLVRLFHAENTRCHVRTPVRMNISVCLQILSYLVACDHLCQLGYDMAQVEEALEMFQNCETKVRHIKSCNRSYVFPKMIRLGTFPLISLIF